MAAGSNQCSSYFPRRDPDAIVVVAVAVRPVELRLPVVRVHVADVRVAVHGLFSSRFIIHHIRKRDESRSFYGGRTRGKVTLLFLFGSRPDKARCASFKKAKGAQPGQHCC